MNPRLTAVLFGVVSVLLVGLLVAVLTDDPDAAAVQTGGVVESLARAGVREKDIDAVELTRTEPTEQTLVFSKSGEAWSQTQPFPAKLDQAEVTALVRDLYRAKPVDHPERTNNLALTGLSPATARVTLKSKDQALTVNLGRTVGGANGVVFATTSARPDAVVALSRRELGGVLKAAGADGAGLAWAFVKWGPDYRLKKLLGADLRDPAGEATAVKVTAGGKQLALARPAGSGGWAFTAPANYGPADDAGDAPGAPTAPFTGVRPLLSALTAVTVASADDYVESPGDLAALGLAPNDPAAVRVELVSPAGTDAVTFGKPVLGADGKPVTPAKVYAKLDGDAGVVRVAFDRLDALRATVNAPAELRSRDFLPSADRERVDALDLAVGGAVVKLRKVQLATDKGPEERWVVYGGPAGPTYAKPALVGRLVDALTRPKAGREALAAPADAAVTGAEVRATVKAWVAGVDPAADAKLAPGQFPAEPTLKGTPAAEFVVGKRDGDRVTVRKTAGGVSTDFKPSDAVLTLATTPRVDWIDPRFASFNQAKVTRLTFNRGADQYDLEKKGEQWVFAQPEALKGRAADTTKIIGVIDQLAGLTADRVLAEQPSPDDLKRVNLDPVSPRMRVTVAVQDDVNKTRTYEFGADTEDGQAVHFRQAGNPVLVRANRRPLDTLGGADLRDPVVIKLDPAKVTRLRLRGWKGLVGADPLTYQLERKGNDWVSTTPNANPDTAKVTALVTAAASARAEAFAGPGKPEHGTDVTVNPQAVELVMDRSDGPPVALVLGAAADGGRVYAAASTLPGETFVFNPAGVKAYTERPAAFQK